jgi:hypothetical protein
MVIDCPAGNVDAFLTRETLFFPFTKKRAIGHKDSVTHTLKG